MKKLFSPGVVGIVYTRNFTPVPRSFRACPLVFGLKYYPPETVRVDLFAILKNNEQYLYSYEPPLVRFSVEADEVVGALNRAAPADWQGSTGGFLFNKQVRRRLLSKELTIP